MCVDCNGRYMTIHTWKRGTELDTHTAPTSASWFRSCADGWGRLVQGTLCATPATAWGGLHPRPWLSAGRGMEVLAWVLC